MRVAFLVLGALFFGIAVLDRVLGLLVGFSTLLLTIFLTWLFAFLIGPLVTWLDKRLPLGRGLAVAVAYGMVIGAIGLFVVAVAQIGAAEASDLVGRTDEITASIATFVGNLQGLVGIDRSTIDLAALVQDLQEQTLPALTQQLADQTQTIAASVVSVFGTLFIIVVLSLYAVTDPDAITGTVRRIVPNRHADTLLLVQRTVGRAFRGFLRAQIVLALIQIGLTLVIGVVFGLPYLFLLTVSTALLMFIPFFGPPLALIPIAFVALAFRPDVALIVIVVLVITQTILVNAVQPRLLREGVGLHPILVIVALLAGAQVAGLWGAIFGIPVVAIVNLLLRYIIDARAVNEVEGVELSDMVAEIQAENPDVEVEDAVAIAADRVEALIEPDPPVMDTRPT
ncbi:MAG: AI-2E family transporter [Chloroflexi bacterium]|nr:AI-2E family transporter [Chloroflexota bacterium]